MTVKELKAKLSKLPEDMTVIVYDDYQDHLTTVSVIKVTRREMIKAGYSISHRVPNDEELIFIE